VDTIFADGPWQPSHGIGRNPVTNPATGEVWGSVPDGTPDDVDAAVGSAQRAFEGEWPRLTPSERAAYLVRRDPLGVCALIAPWNFPINTASRA
jgi:aldehyde dehydrogenase (NAD+)